MLYSPSILCEISDNNRSIYVGSALVAEGLALREALTTCKALELKRVTCVSDSAQLIKALNTEEFHSELYGILSDVGELLCSFDVISFHWIPREKNCMADKTAKQCLVEEEAIMAVA